MIIIGIGGFLKVEESCIAVRFLLLSKDSDPVNIKISLR